MASSKNYTEVLIGGKVFTLSGFESEDYLQKVSTYLNHKIEECTSSDGYRKQSAEARSVLLALNIADDYFKAAEQARESQKQRDDMEKESYSLKHDLVTMQMKLENLERKLQEAMLSVKKRYGKNAMLKGMNLEEGATAIQRNDQIGGHRA